MFLKTENLSINWYDTYIINKSLKTIDINVGLFYFIFFSWKVLSLQVTNSQVSMHKTAPSLFIGD